MGFIFLRNRERERQRQSGANDGIEFVSMFLILKSLIAWSFLLLFIFGHETINSFPSIGIEFRERKRKKER
jgi:hypothetical protein